VGNSHDRFLVPAMWGHTTVADRDGAVLGSGRPGSGLDSAARSLMPASSRSLCTRLAARARSWMSDVPE
jgi:hypothetical protein